MALHNWRLGAWFVAALGAGASLPAQIYVSPGGDDGHGGRSAAAAVRTLARAQGLAREANGSLSSDLEVILADGVYALAEPLVLDARDSGSNGHRVIYRAAEGAHPILSGGVAVTGWREVDPARHLWAAPVPAALAAAGTRQLYVDGVRAWRTRGRLPVRLTKIPEGYEADSDAMARWRNPAAIEFVYTGGNAVWSEGSYGLGAWTEPRCPLARIEGRRIVMAQPAWDNCTRRVAFPDPQFHRSANLVGPSSVGREPEYVENAYELLGTPGQWYLDREAGLIYYVPRSGENLATADVEAPVLQSLVEGRGTPEAPVHDIVFRGLQFSYATWLFPSTPEGFPEIQANLLVTGPEGWKRQGLGRLYPDGTEPYGNWTSIAGNVAFACARRVAFEDDAFVHLGGAGLVLGDGAQQCLVQGSIFTDISGNGLMLGGVDRPEAGPELVVCDNRILDNRFVNVAAEFHGGIGIWTGYAQRTLIAHNQIDHVPYSAISMGWGGWPDKVRQPGVPNNSHDNVVSENLIFDHMQLLADGAGIYTQGLTGPDLARGEKVVGNVVHDQLGSGHAIYSDNGSCYMTIARNVIVAANHDNWGSRHHDYYPDAAGREFDPIVVEDNYWQQGDPDTGRGGVVEARNHLISALEQAPAAVLGAAGLEIGYRGLLARAFCPAVAPDPPSRVAVWAGDRCALVTWNPPLFDGGAPVRSYTIRASTGETFTVSEADFRSQGYARIAELRNGRGCTFVVTANNGNGRGVPSLPSAMATPSAKSIHRPSAPKFVALRRQGGMASVHFSPPESDGGAPVVAYVVTVYPGKRRVVFSGRKVLVLAGNHVTFGVVDGLAQDAAYDFTLAAVNVAGESPAVRPPG